MKKIFLSVIALEMVVNKAKLMDRFVKITLSLLALILSCSCFAQKEQTAGRVTPKEFSIPASPVFDLMGVTSSQINRTSDIKDFKVDWSFKSWRLNPNLAIQAQPIWELLYNRKDLSSYQATSPFMRKLASLDISIGSVQDENNDRRIGFAAKINLLKQRDPLMAKELYLDISGKYREEKKELEEQLKQQQLKLDTTSAILTKPGLRNEIKSTEEQLNSMNSRRNEEINSRARIFVSEHWNASSLDVAFGKVYSYKTDSAGSLKSLRLNRNTGFSGWINGSLGIGKKFLLSGLLRNSWYEEELDFLIRNTSTREEFPQKAIAQNTLLTVGMNLRYGGPIYTFFVEFLYEKKGLKTPVEALSDAFKTPASFEIIGNTVKWDVVHPNTLSFGGDWRLSRSVMLNYGMRCVFDENWKFTAFTPVATIACMMR
jgi:hypothetical protein